VVFFQSALSLDVSLQFVVHLKTFSSSHDSFPAIRSSRRQLSIFVTVVFQVTSCHLSPPPPQPGGSIRSIYIPWGRVAYPHPQTRSSNFRHFLRHAWTTLDQIMFSATTQEKFNLLSYVRHDFKIYTGFCVSKHGDQNGFSLYAENCPPFVRDPWKYKINKHELKEEMSKISNFGKAVKIACSCGNFVLRSFICCCILVYNCN
jgi:hypothetical protein